MPTAFNPHIPDSAQRAYAAYRNEFEPLPFSDTTVEIFIECFAKSEGDPHMWLEDQGIGGQSFGAEVLRELARAWVKDPAAVYAVAGTTFWQEMKSCALDQRQAEG
ncbi:hypothetical protein SAMN06265795_12628 [Noviherbaspirillum humi]|uniref:Uncharacterized protein n=1 Tax=Noviherbaspirillum humi TaxID=1688639 RepID=A0A239LUY7_9BURK|nr:hypothetical protein [Noviherbaspirillum humi]SNT33519.1 hypothetical protein SAMN06265795_12628 [Noviherbaspirillum humi]